MILLFQSTRSHGARPATGNMMVRITLFQSTRPHGARLGYCLPFFHCLFVSIHAPARGATVKVGDDGYIYIVSIHAPARGATFDFQHDSGICKVSIHAPARGATTGTRTLVRGWPVFQSTRPHGARQDHPLSAPSLHQFQSTRPHGARRGAWFYRVNRLRFNPRARTGRDVKKPRSTGICFCFNPRARTGRDLVKHTAA